MSNTTIQDFIEYEKDQPISKLDLAIYRHANELKSQKFVDQLNLALNLYLEYKDGEVWRCGTQLDNVDILAFEAVLRISRYNNPKT